ncbi:hypothetical protein E5Q_02611 [Mixia osmundae IAM 14324]|uniref:Uncharacterized protein n=2 Tax=Mixia osmundae (strain CBS 9802 / IAM 14324 / JCM 22182 / KY 12970) TaxID=764103 RepID=G7DZE3_MIXOS|nr:hypothetical protein E5Q_02611 [Mixia osmundae IAM 14324]
MKLIGALAGLLSLGAFAYGQLSYSNARVNCILQINPTGTPDTSHNQIFAFGWKYWDESTNAYSLGTFSTLAYPSVAVGYDADQHSIQATSGNQMSLNIVMVPLDDGTFSSFTASGFVTYNNKVVTIKPTDIDYYGAACTMKTNGGSYNFNLCHTGAARC